MTEERAQYTGWPMKNLVKMLKELARYEHTDVSIAAQAAEEIRNLRHAVSVLLEALDYAAEALDSDNPDIQLRAAVAARETLKRIEGGA